MNNNDSHKPSYISNPFTLSFEAFSRFFSTNQGWAIAIIVLGALGFIGNLFGSPSSSGSSHSSTGSGISSPDATTIIAIVIVVVVFLLFAVLIGSLISTFIKGLFSYVALESEKGKAVSFSEAANATGKRFWNLYFAEMLAVLKIIGWSFLFIIPGVVAAYRYRLLSYIIMDEEAGKYTVAEVHTRTKSLVKNRLLEVFGVSTVAGIIPVAGSLLGLAGSAALYRQMQVYHDQKLEKPAKHWLNYLGFMILAFVLFVLLFIGVVVAIVVMSKN